MDWTTTSTVLKKLRDYHDRTAWGMFANRFHRPLLRFAQRSGLSENEAEDVVQEILLAFAEALKEGKYDRNKGRVSSWLFGIAYRQIANRKRKRAAEQKQLDECGGHPSFWDALPDEAEAQQTWDAEWETSVIAACLRQARSEVADATYRAFEMLARGRTPEEAAAQLGMSRNAVYVAKHRVLKRLQELMREYDEP